MSLSYLSSSSPSAHFGGIVLLSWWKSFSNVNPLPTCDK